MAIAGLSIRLYLDHHVHPRLARDLRAEGFDALATVEAAMESASDDEQLEFAVREGRVILTYNARDFGPLAERWSLVGKQHAGIILSVELKGRAYGELLRRVRNLLDVVDADEMRGTVRDLSTYA